MNAGSLTKQPQRVTTDAPDFTRLPNLFILGAMRGGTTSLHHYLRQHPAIFLTDPRDPRYFDKQDVWELGLAHYQHHFYGKATGYPWRGEASPTYFARPDIVAPRLAQLYGERPLKLVVLLRDPIARLWSHYRYRFNHGYESGDLATAIARVHPTEMNPRLLESGCYYQLLQAWQKTLPRAEFLCLFSEDLWEQPGEQVGRICRWLGVEDRVTVDTSARLNRASARRHGWFVRFVNRPPYWVRATAKLIWPYAWMRNHLRRQLREQVQQTPSQPSRPQIEPDLLARLRAYYADDVAALSHYLDRDLSHWLR